MGGGDGRIGGGGEMSSAEPSDAQTKRRFMLGKMPPEESLSGENDLR